MESFDDRLPWENISNEKLAEMYSWSFEDALKAQKVWSAENPTKPRGPLFMYDSLKYIEAYRKEYKKNNDKKYILPVIFECLMESLPIPAWCAQGYIDCYYKIKRYEVKSLDDCFSKPYPKGTHINSKKKELNFGFAVYHLISEIKMKDPSIPIDENLFEEIGRKLGIGGKTLVSEYYYKQKEKMEKILKL